MERVLDPLVREKYKLGTEEGRQKVIAERRSKFGTIPVEIISGEGDARSVEVSTLASKNVSVLDHDYPNANTTSPTLDNNLLLQERLNELHNKVDITHLTNILQGIT